MQITKHLSNLHTHTVYSDGKKTAEENVRRAAELGLVSIGISDHSPTDMYGSDFFTGRQAEYSSSIRALAERYRGETDVFVGLELDSFFNFNREYYDYIIASVHFVKGGEEYLPVDISAEDQRQCIEKYFGGCELDYVKTYYDDLVRHVEASKPDIVGHFDLLTKFKTIDEESEEYKKTVTEAIGEIVKTCPRFEVNTGAFARGYKRSFYPEDYALREIRRLGGSVTVNSDCHDGINLNACFDAALNAVRAAGFTHIDRLTRDGFVRDEIAIK